MEYPREKTPLWKQPRKEKLSYKTKTFFFQTPSAGGGSNAAQETPEGGGVLTARREEGGGEGVDLLYSWLPAYTVLPQLWGIAELA